MKKKINLQNATLKKTPGDFKLYNEMYHSKYDDTIFYGYGIFSEGGEDRTIGKLPQVYSSTV